LAAAQQGHAPAQCDLGALYAEGKGVKQSYADALKWLRKAAEQGDTLAQTGLGSLYGKGFRDKTIGFFERVTLANASVDRVEAYMWFSLALKGGHASAARDLSLLRLLMSADEIKAAEKKVQEFSRYNLQGRPFTERLLRLAARLRDGPRQAAERVPETLEAEIDQAIVLIAVEIVTDATSHVFGKVVYNFSPLPSKFYIAGVFAFVVVMSLSREVEQENYIPSRDLTMAVIYLILTPRENAEVISLYKKTQLQFTGLVKAFTHPKVKQWVDTVMQLTSYYVIDEKTRKDAKEKHFFGEALKSLVDATE
jgi:hypothetical protein